MNDNDPMVDEPDERGSTYVVDSEGNEVDVAKLERAFALVDPKKQAEWIAAADPRFAGFAQKASWKDGIQALVLQAELDAAGVGIADVADAIRFFTATDPRISREKIGHRAHEPAGAFADESRDGWLITATGYRNGPAGP